MKQNRLHRGMALLLAVCMALTMNGGFVFAAEEPLPAETQITETTEATLSTEASSEAAVPDDEQEKPADPMGSASEGETPSVDAPVCTCNPAPGTSSVEGHGEDCLLYEEPEPPADEQGECVCPTVDSGEVVHGEDCPLYVAPEKPAAPEAPNDALAAVYALIDALPTLAELEAVDPESADFPAYLEKLRADVLAARAAYDALTDEEKANFDPARLEKLAALEAVLAAMPMLMAGDIPVLDTNSSYQNVKYTLTSGAPNTAAVNGVVDSTAVTGVDNVLTIPAQVQKDGTVYDVTTIKAFNASQIKEIIVPTSVTTIDYRAFSKLNSEAIVKLQYKALPTGWKVFNSSFEAESNKFYIYDELAVTGSVVDRYQYQKPYDHPYGKPYGIIINQTNIVHFNNENNKIKIAPANTPIGGYTILGIDSKGKEIQTTYRQAPYSTYLSTDAAPSVSKNGKLVRLPGEGMETYVWKGIWVKANSEFISGGQYLRVTYTLRNSSNAEIPNVSLGVDADMTIGIRDWAPVYPTPTGFRVVDESGGIQFTLNCKNTPGADNVDTMWYGNITNRSDHTFTDLANKTDLTGTNSGLAFSWQKMSIPANGSITRSVVFGVNVAAAPPVLPADKPFGLKVSADLADLKVTAKVTDTAGLTDTLYYKVDNSTDASFGSATATGSEMEIVGTIPKSALSDGDNLVRVWVMNDKGAMSETVTFKVTVTDGKISEIDGSTPEVDIIPVAITTATPTHATTYGGTGSIAIKASGGKGTYQYSKDNTHWQDEATLTGLAAGDYTVYARDKADATNVSAGTAVTVKQPAAKPVVTKDTANTVETMTYGDLLKLGVTATAPDGGTLTYQWYEVVSEQSVPIKDANSNIYAPTNIARIAAGEHKYYCYVINTKAGATGTAYNNQPSITVTVAKHTPTVTLVANPTTTTHGETVKLTATVNAASGGGTPTGTVTFKDGETVLDTVAVTRATSGHGEAVCNYAIPISHGAITATFTSTSANYNDAAPATVTVTVSKMPLNITVTAPASLTYDGAAKAATLTGVTGLTEGTDYTLTYSPANPTDVGSYTATFALTTAGDAKYTASGTLSVSFAITQAAGSGTVSCADIMFGGTVAPVPVSTTNGITNVTYLYKVKNANDSTYTATVPAVVGDYTVKATFAATTNYTEATATADFKITPAAVTGITVTPYTGVYDGEEHPIVTVTGTQTGDKVYYTILSGSPTETVPMVTKVADNMTVLVKVTRANHTDYAPTDWFSAKVGEKEVAATFTVPTDLVYDGNDKTVTAAITNKCGADDVSLTLGNATGKAVGEYTTTVTGLSGAAAGNYKLPSPAPEQKWEITGTPYPHPITLPTASGITYGQKLADSVLTGDNIGTGVFTWNDGAILPPSGSYTATVVFDPTDPNFDSVTREVQVAVAKADVMLEVSGTKAYHTTPIANADFVVSNITGMVNGETDVSLLGTLTLTSDGNKQAAIVGSYDISVAQSGESNYNVTTTSVANGFTVTRAAQTLSGAASYQKLLTEADFPLDVKTDSTDTDAAVTYTLTNDGGGAVTLDADGKTVRIKKPGTATITANGLQTANFAAAAPLTITVTIGSNPAVRALATEGITTTEAKIGGVVTTGTIATTGYGLEYKKATDADYTPISASETATGDVKTLTHTLTGLEKDTEYAVRIWAKTADKTFESVTRFRTAAEQPPTGKVEGAITDNSGENTAITVTIEAGNTVIASHTVKAGGGKFTFEALPDGFYNLVADNGKYKVTRMVEIVKGGAVTNVQMEIGKTQSVVEIVTPDTPNVAVGGLPELFGNDTLFTQDNKDVITAGGTVEFKLTVEKKDTPADAEEIDKIAEGKVGVYLDIGLLKTVIDQNGREQESELVPDLGANEITIVIPLPKELQGKQSYTVYRVHNGTAEKLDSTHNADGNTLTIQSSLFSTYAIAYTEKSGGTGGGSGGNSHDEDNYNFWQKVKDKIHSSDNGDTVKAGAGSYDKMPESVMDALRKNPGVTLEITWNGGDKITIPAGGALEKDGLRIYYPLAYLAELFAKGSTPAPEKNHINPETGGVWEVNAPITAAQTPAIPTPKNEGTAATPEQAQVERAAIEPPTAPEITAIPDVAEVADSAPSRNSAVLFTGIAFMLAAAAVACGVILWKKKNEEEQTNEK